MTVVFFLLTGLLRRLDVRLVIFTARWRVANPAIAFTSGRQIDLATTDALFMGFTWNQETEIYPLVKVST